MIPSVEIHFDSSKSFATGAFAMFHWSSGGFSNLSFPEGMFHAGVRNAGADMS